MNLATETTPLLQPGTPSIGDLSNVVGRLNGSNNDLWRGHYDSQLYHHQGGEQLVESVARPAADLLQGLEILKAAEGQYDTDVHTWIPQSHDVINRVVGAAESIRRRLSSDVYALSDTLPAEQEDIIRAKRMHHPTQFLLRTRAEDRLRLEGSQMSVIGAIIQSAENSGNYSQLRPITSRRQYHEIVLEDVNALDEVGNADFVQLVADVLSPIRNEHSKISEVVLKRVAEGVALKKGELQSCSQILLLNAWHIAQQNSYTETAQYILTLVEEGTALQYYMSEYEHRSSTEPSPELARRNADHFLQEYTDISGQIVSPENDAQRPTVRMRITPTALWSVAMRDGGFLRAGNEGTLRKSNRDYSAKYSRIRRQVEKVVYGDAALDGVAHEPITYGYYATDGSASTQAMQALGRIYGNIELVLKPDIDVEKRVIYGDSMNAIELTARGTTPNVEASNELIRDVVESRVIPEKDAEVLARVISYLHGYEQNTQFNSSANPYVECLMRGRLSLDDCEEIRIPAKIFDKNQKLFGEIQKLFTVKLVRI
jgi:hypothetical protein